MISKRKPPIRHGAGLGAGFYRKRDRVFKVRLPFLTHKEHDLADSHPWRLVPPGAQTDLVGVPHGSPPF